MNTNIETTVVTVNSPVQEELQRMKDLAELRNMVQIGAEFWDDNNVIVWGMKIIGKVEGKAGRYEAKLSRAVMVAPMGNGKGHRMSGAFKAIYFQFDVKTGDIFTRSGETSERKAKLQVWASALIGKYKSGLHSLANGEFKSVKGYNQLRAAKFETFVARYNGNVKDTSYDNTPLAKDVQAAVLD